MYIKPLKIGNVELINNIILAPMAGVTDKPFRKIVKEYGMPGLVCTEMASGKAIFYKDEKTKKLMDTFGEKRPISVQIFGSDVNAMAEASKEASKYGDIIDINMGCPAPKVVKNGDGSKLLLNLELLGQIVETVVKNTDKPVTVKIRIGWDGKNIVAVEAAKIIENVGASAIIVHGRTREEYYSGNVDLNIIKQVKEAVNIPVIGNGDIKDSQSARKMFECTGVDGIMIGRGIFGKPWLIDEIICDLSEGEKKFIKLTNKDKLKIIEEHINFAIEENGEYVGIREMRKHLCWYLKDMPNSSKARNEINKLESKEEIIEKLTQIYQ